MKLLSTSLLAISLLLTSCSSTLSVSPPEDFSISSIDLFMSRASLYKTDFEHYRLDGDTLFSECGTIEHGRYFPRSQKAVSLGSPPQELNISSYAVIHATENKGVELEAPGDNDSFFDPGILTLKLNSSEKDLELRTSLDSISSPSNSLEKRLKSFSEQVRNLPPEVACNNVSFYGIKRAGSKSS